MDGAIILALHIMQYANDILALMYDKSSLGISNVYDIKPNNEVF